MRITIFFYASLLLIAAVSSPYSFTITTYLITLFLIGFLLKLFFITTWKALIFAGHLPS